MLIEILVSLVFASVGLDALAAYAWRRRDRLLERERLAVARVVGRLPPFDRAKADEAIVDEWMRRCLDRWEAELGDRPNENRARPAPTGIPGPGVRRLG